MVKLKSLMLSATDERNKRKIKIENPAPIKILLIVITWLLPISLMRDDRDDWRVESIALVNAPKSPKSNTPIKYPVRLISEV